MDNGLRDAWKRKRREIWERQRSNRPFLCLSLFLSFSLLCVLVSPRRSLYLELQWGREEYCFALPPLSKKREKKKTIHDRKSTLEKIPGKYNCRCLCTRTSEVTLTTMMTFSIRKVDKSHKRQKEERKICRRRSEMFVFLMG